MPKLKFETLDVDALSAGVTRAKIQGGWLVMSISSSGGGVTFYPDPEHKWDGGSLADDRARPLRPRRGHVDGLLRQ